MFPVSKIGGGRATQFYPVLRGRGAQNISGPEFSHFVAPLPIINDRSLIFPGRYLYAVFIINDVLYARLADLVVGCTISSIVHVIQPMNYNTNTLRGAFGIPWVP